MLETWQCSLEFFFKKLYMNNEDVFLCSILNNVVVTIFKFSLAIPSTVGASTAVFNVQKKSLAIP
jgi:hypothetical protein